MSELADSSVARTGSGTGPVRGGWWTRAMTVQAVILAALLYFHYQHVIDRLVWMWRNYGDWSHGFLIPVFSLYYLYLRRHRMPLGLDGGRTSSQLVGAGLLLLAFAIYVHFTLAKVSYPTSVALVISVAGVVLMVSNWAWARWSWFAIAFLFFALPLPERLFVAMTMPLRFIAARVSATVLSLVPDMEAEPVGAVVEYFYRGRASTLDIEQACSGMRLLITMSALGVAMAFLSERPLWHRFVMILSCVPIAIFCNIVRVTATGFMVVFEREELARGFWHTMLGLGMLAIAFSLYGSLSYVLNHLFIEQSSDEPTTAVAPTAGASR